MAESEELGAKEAATYLGVTTTRLNEIRRTRQNFGRLVAGRYWVYSKAELDAYKEQREERPKGGRPKSASLIPTPVIRAAI
jgi:hypothetical protein